MSNFFQKLAGDYFTSFAWALAIFIIWDFLRWLGNLGKRAQPEMTFYGTIQDCGGKEFSVRFFWDQTVGADLSTLHAANVTLRPYAGDQNFTYQLCAEHDASEDWKGK